MVSVIILTILSLLSSRTLLFYGQIFETKYFSVKRSVTGNLSRNSVLLLQQTETAENKFR